MRVLIICSMVMSIFLFVVGTSVAQMCPMPMAKEGDAKPETKTAAIDCLGNKMVCPVMGTIFKADKDTKSYEYEGKAYYFCCPGCADKFKADSKKYTGEKEKPKSEPHHH